MPLNFCVNKTPELKKSRISLHLKVIIEMVNTPVADEKKAVKNNVLLAKSPSFLYFMVCTKCDNVKAERYKCAKLAMICKEGEKRNFFSFAFQIRGKLKTFAELIVAPNFV